MAEYFLDNPIACQCKGEQFEFGMEFIRVEPVGNIGSIIGNQTEWNILSCSSLSFRGEVSGTLEVMTVPGEGIPEFIRIFVGKEPDEARCICRNFIIGF